MFPSTNLKRKEIGDSGQRIMNCGQKKVIIDGKSLLLASLLINQPLASACRRKPSRLFIFFYFLPIQLPFHSLILTQSRCSSQTPAVFPQANSLLIYYTLQKGKSCKRSEPVCLAFILQIKPHKHTFPDLHFRYSFHNSPHNPVAPCQCS